MQFKNYKNQTSIPFRIYADSEAILKTVSGEHGEFQEHIPCGFCFHTVCESGEEFSPVLIRGENCVDEFLEKLIEHVEIFKTNQKSPSFGKKEKEKSLKIKRIVGFAMKKSKEEKLLIIVISLGSFVEQLMLIVI